MGLESGILQEDLRKGNRMFAFREKSKLGKRGFWKALGEFPPSRFSWVQKSQDRRKKFVAITGLGKGSGTHTHTHTLSLSLSLSLLGGEVPLFLLLPS